MPKLTTLLFLCCLAAAAQTPQFSDDFTKDATLNTGLWSTSTATLQQLGTVYVNGTVNGTTRFIPPQIAFSGNGMTLSGVNAALEMTGIQTLQPFSPPFSVQATVQVIQAHGRPAALYLVTADVSKVLGADIYGTAIDVDTTASVPTPTLVSQLTTGVWYTLSIAIDAAGVATVAVYDVNGNLIKSSGNITFGTNPLYLVIAQVEGIPAGGITGANQALWQRIAVTGGAETHILPQLAFGGGWYTALYFTNTTASPVSFTVSFNGDDGNPLPVPALGSSSVRVNLAVRGTARVECPNADPFMQGYVSVPLPAGVTGYGVFRQSVPGRPDQEAVVPLSGTTATTSTLLFDDTFYVTAVAIVSLSSANNTVTATARDNLGNIIGTASILLPPNGKTAARLRDIPGLSAVAGTLGSVDFTVTSGNVAALGLRFFDSAFTSIPTSDR